MVFRDGIRYQRDPGAVLAAMPFRAIRAQASFERLVDLRVGEGFGLAIVPPESAESREPGTKVLLDIGAETVFARDVPGVVGDLGTRDFMLFKLSNGVAIDAHIRVVGI